MLADYAVYVLATLVLLILNVRDRLSKTVATGDVQ